MRALKRFISYFIFIFMVLIVVSCKSTKTVKYSVLHYLENVDNDNYTLYEEEILKGKTGTYTNASYKNYEGFSSKEDIKQKKISSNDNTMRLYYSRNKYDFSVICDDEVGSVSDVEGNYKYYTSVTAVATPNVGYLFDGWYKGEELISSDSKYTFNMPAESITYEAKFSLDNRLSNFVYEIDDNGVVIKGIKDKNTINIVVPSYVSRIDEGAFSGCSKVESITLPFIGGSNAEYGNGILYPLGYIFGREEYEGSTLTHQNYRETYIGEDSYHSELQIAGYYIPNSLKEVELNGASVLPAYGLSKTNIKKLTLNPGLKIVATNALDYVDLDDLYFNGKLNDLCKIDCKEYSLLSDKYNFFFRDKNNSYTVFGDTLYLDSSVEEIGAGFFYRDLDLKTVEISSNLKKIGENAFYCCDNIEAVYFDGNIKEWASIEMGDSANPCVENAKLYLLDPNGSIEYNGNKYSPLGSDIDLSGLERIGSNVFNSFTSITSVILGDNLLSIGEDAFKGTSITSITLPSTIKNIEYCAFRSCDNLTKIYYNGTIDRYVEIELESEILSDTISLYVLNSNGSIEYNGKKYSLVEGNVSLTDATKISSYVFADYNKITSLILNEGIESINDSFIAGTSIEEITIPSSVKFIDECAFYDADNLKKIINLSDIDLKNGDYIIPQGCVIE